MPKYTLRPDSASGYILVTWVVLVAYVVYMAILAVDVAGRPDARVVAAHRVWELHEAADDAIDPCGDFAAHACAHNGLVHAQTVWAEVATIARNRVAATDVYAECLALGNFHDLVLVDILDDNEWETGSGDGADVGLSLLAGLDVNGVLARVGPRHGRHVLHLWHANDRFGDPVAVAGTCIEAYLAAAGHGHLVPHAVVHSPLATCARLEAATNATSPADYPRNCHDVVTAFASRQVAAAMDSPHRAAAAAVVAKVVAAMGVPNVTVNVGMGDTVVPDAFGGDGHLPSVWGSRDPIQAVWARRVEDRLNLVGAATNASRWDVDPAAVHVSYDAALGALFVPQGALWPPLVSVHYTEPLNLGGLGLVVARELGRTAVHASEGVRAIMARTNASRAAVVIPDPEADYRGARALDAISALTTTTLLQFASLSCGTDGATNEVVAHLDQWRRATCARAL